MSLIIDQRIGSNHLAKLIPGSQLELLDYGDVCFESADGHLIGIELKTVSDAISSMTSGRLADHQVPGLIQMYDVVYLIVEGYYRCCPETGMVQWKRGKDWQDIWSGRSKVLWSSFDGWLTSMETLGGIHLRRTTSVKETAATIQSLYQWWQKDNHKSLHVFNSAYDIAAIERPGLCRRMAACLPLIGWSRSQDVANHFKTVANMVNAGVNQWSEIEGIGVGIAKKVVAAMNGKVIGDGE